MTRRTLLSSLTFALLVAAPAAQAVPPAANMSMAFDTPSPGQRAGLTVHLEYRDARDPNAKPPMIRSLTVNAPAGTRFDGSVVPLCRASNDELMARGASACPESPLGGGEISTITGSPADPYMLDTVLLNTPEGFTELVNDRASGRTLAVERLKVEGSSFSAATIARAPGGPPDGETTVRDVDIVFDRGTGYVTTPPSCPADGWSYSGSFTFDEGTVGAGGMTTCDAGSADRLVLRVSPRRVQAGERTRFRLRVLSVRGAERTPLENARISFAGRKLRTDARGRAVMHARLWMPGLREARAAATGVGRDRAFVRVTR